MLRVREWLAQPLSGPLQGCRGQFTECISIVARKMTGVLKPAFQGDLNHRAAFAEQGAATQEISRNVQQAAQGTMQVSSSIADVQRSAGETGSASSQVLSAAQILSGDSSRLKTEVERFLGTVRAA